MRGYVFHAISAAGLLFMTACSENPTADAHDTDEGLSVSLFSISDDHVSTLEEITFTARIVGHDGEVAPDVEGIRVEFRLADSEDWGGSDMTGDGSDYVAARTFMTSGDFDVRVVASRHGQEEPEVIFEMDAPLRVERAHREAGGYRVEYENFPGHVHEGEMAMVAFWVFEDEGDDHGDGHGSMHGLAADIHCGNPSGSSEMHEADESQEGRYTAMHTFEGHGEAHMEFHFEVNGEAFEVDFHVPIAGVH